MASELTPLVLASMLATALGFLWFAPGTTVAADLLESDRPAEVGPPLYDLAPRHYLARPNYADRRPYALPPRAAAPRFADPGPWLAPRPPAELYDEPGPPPPYGLLDRPQAPLYAAPGPGYEPEPQACYWTRGERVWDGYRWRQSPVQVCE
jgi:hypothetical protein